MYSSTPGLVPRCDESTDEYNVRSVHSLSAATSLSSGDASTAAPPPPPPPPGQSHEISRRANSIEWWVTHCSE